MTSAPSTSAVSETESFSLSPGQVVGPYCIAERLGAGGMGIVYRAHDGRLHRDVAIKVIRPDSATPARNTALLQEARLASSLNHPGIVTIYDVLNHGEMQCLVMEYIAGAPLTEAIAAGTANVEEAVRLAIEIGQALGAAHRSGVVHRDLKPGNIMLCADRRVKIVDFGLSTLQRLLEPGDETRSLQSVATFGGTIAYMSPESARGEAIDPRGDIFSFAVTFHELLTGKLPFSAPDPARLMWAMQRDEPTPPSVQKPGLTAAFDAIVSRGLHKDPKQRYGKIEEMVEDIRRVPVQGGTASYSGDPGASTGAAFTLGLPPAGTQTRISVVEPPRAGSEKTSIAVLPFSSLSPDPEDGYLAAGLAAELVSALMGLPGLRIAPQLASFRLHERGVEPIAASRELNTQYVLTGTLRRAGPRIRVTAELTDGVAETVCWSRSYNSLTADLFSVQEQIARSIVNALGGEFIRAATDFAIQSPTDNLDAWGLLRKAYHIWNYRFSVEGVLTAIALCRRAVALDPQYAKAQAYLSLYLMQSCIHSISPDPVQDFTEALASADVAMRMAPGDAEVLASTAIVLIHSGQYEKAVGNTRQATRLAPFDLVSWGYLSFAHACAGGPAQLKEAAKILTRLIEDAPDHPSLPYWEQFFTIAALRQGNFDLAMDHGRRAVELQPGFVFNQILFAEALCRAGLEAEARTIVTSISEYNPAFTIAAFEAVALLCCRSPESVEQLCGCTRALHLLPPS